MRSFLATSLAVLLVAGCNMKVTGVVTDQATGHPLGACAVSIGPKYTHTDPTGRYQLVTKYDPQAQVQFVASGYAVQTKTLAAANTRYPVLDAAMVRLRASSAPPGARFDPYTGEPLQHEVPRFDPYTGKPLGAPSE